MNVPVRFSDEALREGVATGQLQGLKDITPEDVKAIVNAVLAMQAVRNN